MPRVRSTVKLLSLTFLLVSMAAPHAHAQGACDRACLTGFLDEWFKGLVNSPADLLPDTLRFENGLQTTGLVRNMVRFGLKNGQKSQAAATANSRIVAEFFTVKRGMIQEVQAVLFNVPDSLPTQWPAEYGPGRGGAGW